MMGANARRRKYQDVEVESEISDAGKYFAAKRKFAPDPLIYEVNGASAFLPIANRASPNIQDQARGLHDYGIEETEIIRAQYVDATSGHSELEINHAKQIVDTDRVFDKQARIVKKYDQEVAKVNAKKDWNPYRLNLFEQKLAEIGPVAERARNLRDEASPRVLALAERLREIRKLDRKPKRFKRKAQRQIACQLFGRRWDGNNCDCVYYRPFRCRNRYCPNCGPHNHQVLLAKYSRLGPLIAEFLADNPLYTLKCMDITAKKTPEQKADKTKMPTSRQVQKFKCDIKKLRDRINDHLAARFGWRVSRMLTGYLYCLEFGGANNNLHAHGILLSPYIEVEWVRQQWKEIRGDGSFEVWIAEARATKTESAFDAALGHSLKYTGKFAGSSPNIESSAERLVELEKAFDECRRVSTLGWFYNRLPKEDEVGDVKVPCPCGKNDSYLKPVYELGWIPVLELDRLGIRNYDDVPKAKLTGRQIAQEILSPHI